MIVTGALLFSAKEILACYECQLGEIKNAKNYLKEAFEIDSNWRAAALDDPDLQPFNQTVNYVNFSYATRTY